MGGAFEKVIRHYLIGSVIALGLVLFGVLPYVANKVYDKVFDNRFETEAYLARDISEFKGLKVKEDTFTNDKGVNLACYHYSKSNRTKGVVILSHGYGTGGHSSYLDLCDFFASHGFKVFTYDAMGNDKSPGTVGGLPQGIIDLDYALNYLNTLEEYNELPRLLFGHSWGGYNVMSVLPLHAEVRGVIEVAGFERTVDMIDQEVSRLLTPALSHIACYYTSFVERFKYKDYSKLNGLRGAEESTAKIMCVHSLDDQNVDINKGYMKYFDKYQNDDRFTFILNDKRGHFYNYYDLDSITYYNEVVAEYHDNYYDDSALISYLNANLNKSRAYNLDKEITKKFLDFYNSCL